MVFLGSIAVIVNPLVGVGIVAKAISPGMTGLFTKYGIRPIGEKVSQAQLEKKIREAEIKIKDDFEASSTIQVINPILQELDLALRTTESEHDPLIDFDLSEGSINKLDDERWRDLTKTALHHIYSDVIDNPKVYKKACLGPEDIR